MSLPFCARRACGPFPPSADGEIPQPGNGVLLSGLVCTRERLPRKGLPPSHGVSLRNSCALENGCRVVIPSLCIKERLSPYGNRRSLCTF